MKINPNKDVIIIGHPRSGSYWLQSCLPHFNCREAFNVKNFDIVGEKDNRFIMANYRDIELSPEEETRLIKERIELVDSITVPKCVKILTYQFNDVILEWVNRQDADIIWIERLDNRKAFRSLLIADKLGAYVGAVDDATITVDLDRALWLHGKLKDDERDESIMESIKGNVTEVYYENLLADDTFDKSTSSMKIQNTTKVIISNWREIVDHLHSKGIYDYSNS
jgi:hypothetical protein